MQEGNYVDFLCLSCGLQGVHLTSADSCPKCGERLLTLVRPQPNKPIAAGVLPS